jgi:hypothetical protein
MTVELLIQCKYIARNVNTFENNKKRFDILSNALKQKLHPQEQENNMSKSKTSVN